MPNISDSPVAAFVNWTTEKDATHLFYSFEPWDGPDGEKPRHTPGGARFQISNFLSTTYMRMAIAANQVGKTHGRAVECIIMLTGELPYCFRYAAGADTGIARATTRNNIIRWGRRDINTGEVLDHCPDAEDDGTWDCGNIIGVGEYPVEKICREKNQQIWVCTYKQARDDTWVDLFKELIPEHCLDKTRGTEGYSRSEYIYYLQDGMSIRLKTYEQGWERTEAKMTWHIVLDEEPPDRKYYTGCVMHATTLSFSFTPLRGMSYTYTDLFEPWLNGSKDIEVFQATKYDCPYSIVADVEKQERQLKGYEREPKIYGRFSQQEGKPYYDWELCAKFVYDYQPSHKFAHIYPWTTCKTVEQALRSRIVMKPTPEPGTDTWEIYEDPKPNIAYWAGADCGKGADDPDEAQDKSVCYIFRKPLAEKKEDMEWPVCVACLYTSELTENFAWMVLYGAILYNHATLIPETRGEDGTAFHVEIRDYPFWFRMVVINDRTKKTTEHIGFNTNSKTRTPLFNKQRKWINSHENKSGIPHQGLLIEQSKIIFIKGRPDHPKSGTSDCVVAWCLGLWMWDDACKSVRVPAGELTFRGEGKALVSVVLERVESFKEPEPAEAPIVPAADEKEDKPKKKKKKSSKDL